MSHPHERLEITPGIYVALIITFLATLPGFYFGITHTEIDPIYGSLMFGIAIFGAAFILSWAAEAAQMDMSESLAVAILALIAVLPEYAIDFVFTWRAAHDPSQAHYAIANMTGANRLLVGLGWPFILFIYIFFKKKKEIILEKTQRVEIFYLGIATLYSVTIPLKGSLNLMDMAILVTIFALYTKRAAQLESVEPEFVGPVKIIANMTKVSRRMTTGLFFAFSGTVIFLVAEPFADSLIHTGTQLGIDEFLLIQWLAPIASEAPEFIIAATWTMRGAAGSAMKALISSKVNQWTLLVGTIPLVFSISSGKIRAFPLDTFQDHELFLTAAQSFFAVAVLLSLKFDRKNAVLLLVLFTSQLIFQQIHVEVGILYIVLGTVFYVLQRKNLLPTLKTGLGIGRK